LFYEVQSKSSHQLHIVHYFKMHLLGLLFSFVFRTQIFMGISSYHLYYDVKNDMRHLPPTFNQHSENSSQIFTTAHGL